jgi:hypothetical protein
MLINKSMKIEEIINEFVEPGQAQANKTALDNEVMKRKQREYADEDGIDLETEEAASDLPS